MKKYRISVTSGMSGFFPVLLEFDDKFMNPEIILTGIGRYSKFEDALSEAKQWSECEKIPLEETLKQTNGINQVTTIKEFIKRKYK